VAVDSLVAPEYYGDSAASQAVTRASGFTDQARLAAHLELLASHSWPPLRTATHEGWVLRDSEGANRRGNSVWPRGDVTDLPAALAATARFYAPAGRPAIVQLSPVSRPTGLRAALDAAGYEPDTDPTDVCVATRTGIIAGAAGLAERAAPSSGGVAPRTRVAAAADETWLDTCATGGMRMFGRSRAACVGVLAGIDGPALYVTATLDGAPVGAGRGVVDGEWLGIFSMATLPAARGRGVATAVLTTLATWAAGLGAHRAYLQVEERSAAARRLYTALGFVPVYRYTYRQLPAIRGAAA
jgi:GNAT superfamily N-acetyltransferase